MTISVAAGTGGKPVETRGIGYAATPIRVLFFFDYSAQFVKKEKSISFDNLHSVRWCAKKNAHYHSD